MNSRTPKYARSIVFIALMAMLAQTMAICCAGQRMDASVETLRVVADGRSGSGCHSQAALKHNGSAQIEKAHPESARHNCDGGEGACCVQVATTALDLDNYKTRYQLNNDVQFDSVALPIKKSIALAQTSVLHWQLSFEYQKSDQAVPYYLSHCSFLE